MQQNNPFIYLIRKLRAGAAGWGRRAGAWISLVCYIIILGIFIENGAKWGIAGIIIYLCGYAAYKMYRNRDFLMLGLRHVETQLFGAPLEKEYWKEKKPKMRRITWKKKKA